MLIHDVCGGRKGVLRFKLKVVAIAVAIIVAIVKVLASISINLYQDRQPIDC